MSGGLGGGPDPGASDAPGDSRADVLDALRELIMAGEKYRLAGTDYFGVTTSESLAISYLSARGDLGQTELAHNLGLTTSSTTSLVDRLVSSGYVVRHPHPEDRRRAIVHLTERGERAMAQSRSWLRHALDGFTDSDLDGLGDAFERVAANLRSTIAQIPPPVEPVRGDDGPTA